MSFKQPPVFPKTKPNLRANDQDQESPTNLECGQSIVRQAEMISADSNVKSLTALQTSIGNQAVERFLHDRGATQITREIDGKTNLLMRQEIQLSVGGQKKSSGSRPKNAPRGTKPIDQTGLDHDQIHDIKNGIGAGPADWVGITPGGDVITNDEDGNAENHGPWEDYTHAHFEVPGWLWEALAGVALAAGALALIVCFVTGPCTVGALVSGLGFAAAMLVIGLLNGAEGVEGKVGSNDNKQRTDGQTDYGNAYA